MVQRHAHGPHRHIRGAERLGIAAGRGAQAERVAEISGQSDRERRSRLRRPRGRSHRDGRAPLRLFPHTGPCAGRTGRARRDRTGPSRPARHEAIGNAQLVVAKRPAPREVLLAVLAVQVWVRPYDVRPLASYAVEDISVDAIRAALRRRSLEPGDERTDALLAEKILDRLPQRERRGVRRPHLLVVNEATLEPAADLAVVVEIAPAAIAKLGCVELA